MISNTISYLNSLLWQLLRLLITHNVVGSILLKLPSYPSVVPLKCGVP